MDLAVSLAIFAGVLHIVAFAIYNRQMLHGTSVPNAATWTLWAFLTVLNASSYLVMSGDIVKTILPAASSLACILTFVYAGARGKLSRLDGWDRVALVVGLVSGFVWLRYHSATYANLILQISVAISFVPTCRGVWNDSRVERPAPWFIWSSAYVFSMAVVALRWRGQYEDLVYPLNGLVLHAVVGLLSMRTRTAPA